MMERWSFVTRLHLVQIWPCLRGTRLRLQPARPRLIRIRPHGSGDTLRRAERGEERVEEVGVVFSAGKRFGIEFGDFDAVGQHFRWSGGGKRHRAEEAEESAEEAARFAVGDALFAVGEEGEEDVVDVGRGLGGMHGGNFAAQRGPATVAREEEVFGEGSRSGSAGFWGVVAAAILVTAGDATAFLAVGQDEGAFLTHEILLLTKEKAARWSGLFVSYALLSEYQVGGVIAPNLLGYIGV